MTRRPSSLASLHLRIEIEGERRTAPPRGKGRQYSYPPLLAEEELLLLPHGRNATTFVCVAASGGTPTTGGGTTAAAGPEDDPWKSGIGGTAGWAGGTLTVTGPGTTAGRVAKYDPTPPNDAAAAGGGATLGLGGWRLIGVSRGGLTDGTASELVGGRGRVKGSCLTARGGGIVEAELAVATEEEEELP